MINEINKCLGCKSPRCQKGCPLNQDIRDFIQTAKTDLDKAREIIDNKNILSSFCSLICPHDLQCEGSCVLNMMKKEPVKIGDIEQYIVKNTTSKKQFTKIDKKVLVIGGGPAGISFAYLAIKHQMKVDLFEKESRLGGIPIYGIPNFRYDKSSYKKYIDFVESNANIYYNKTLGVDFKIKDIINDYDYIYIAVGSDRPNNLKIEGNNLGNVIMARDFLTDFNNNKLDLTNKEVVVIGAGNVAMDASRCAVRANAKNTTIVYRRTISESTASKHEIDSAKQDNVTFKFLYSPYKFKGECNVEELIVEKMVLQDKEGDRPVPVGTNEFESIKTDYIILAIGQKLPLEIQNDDYFTFDEWGNIIVNDSTKVFFGGDLVNGPSSVASAINDSYITLEKIINN